MTVFLIDTPRHQIREVETPGELWDLYKLIGCRHIEAHRWPGDPVHWFVIDEEGKFPDPPLARFAIRGFPEALSGRALIVRQTPGGDWIAPTLNLLDVADHVFFEDARHGFIIGAFI